MTDIQLRAAVHEDALAIQQIIAISLGDADTDILQIEDVIAYDSHTLIVAVEGSKVAGFACGFVTPAMDGQRRYELDLLAVHPDFQGRGTGRKLVSEHTQTAINAGVQYSRGLVAVGNIPSQKAFTASGYVLLPKVHAVYVSGDDIYAMQPVPEDAHLIPVETLTYRGIWMEGIITSQSIAAAQAMKTRYRRDSTGAVVSLDDVDSIMALTQANYDYIGEYQWWIKRYSTS